MKDLITIKEFGNIDAKMDELLEECFEKNEAFNDIYNFKKFIVIGKKGSGKTAIYEKIVNTTEYNVFSEGYCLNDYPWHYHHLQANIGVPDNQKYIQSWKYLILISIAKVIVNQDVSIPNSESKLALEHFLKDTYGSTTVNISHIFTPSQKVKFTALSTKFGTHELNLSLPFDVIDMKDLPTVIQEINSVLLEHVMNCLNSNNRYYICFDELDSSFDPENEDYINSLIGLIRAATDFYISAHKNNQKPINICIFLRDDIYNIVKFDDKRKVSQNFTARIEWDTEVTTNTLMKLMEKRFNATLKEGNEDIQWSDVFDSLNKINGKIDKYDYILGLTCLRPRDMIDLCNQILGKFKQRKLEDPSSENIFINKDITSARSIYSTNLYEEFEDEIHKHIPQYDTYLTVIKKIGTVKFELADFISSYKEIIDDSVTNQHCEDILINLYNFSVIGNYKVGGPSGGSERLFKYKNTKNTFQNYLPIVVHNGLAPYLGLKEK